MLDAFRSTAVAFALLLGVAALVLIPLAFTLPDPGRAIATFVLGPFDSVRHIGNIVETATPLMFTGLAVSLMFRAGMFNLGAEGAYFLGAVFAALAILKGGLPAWAVCGGAIVFGGAMGSLACVVPAVLRVRFGASELVTSLMLNYAAMFAGLFVVNYFLRDPNAGAMVSYAFPPAARLAQILPGTRVHIGLVLALAACGAGGVYLFSTRWGYALRVVGANPGYARHLGLPIGRILISVQALAGLIAAAGGAVEMQGLYPRFGWPSLPGAGWDGLVVGILAGNSPLLVPPAALALSYLKVGGDLLSRNYDISAEIVGLIQALVILFATARVRGRLFPFERRRLARQISAETV
jgi:general nucleoside transport system permease protein